MRYALFIPFLISASIASAHGGADERKAKPKVVTPSVRVKAGHPKVMSETALRALPGNALANDVMTITCMIDGSIPCRGLKLSIMNGANETVLNANTGISGIVGLEGLDDHDVYTVKINDAKYEGTATGTTSNSVALDASRLKL
jgi:hypothetical protein